MRRMTWTLILISAVAWGTASWAGGPWYVATDGNNADGLSWATAYTNTQTALNAASASDTIYVKGGTYALSGQLSLTKSGLQLLGGYEGSGTPGNSNPNTWLTVVKPAESTATRLLLIQSVTNATVRGIRFTGGDSGTAAKGSGLFIQDCTNLTLADCQVWSNTAFHADSLAAYGAGLFVTNSSVTLTNVSVRWNLLKVTNDTAANVAFGGGICAMISTCSLIGCAVVDDNVATNTGTAFSSVTYGGGIYLTNTALTMRNGSLNRNTAWGVNGANNNPRSGGGGLSQATGSVALTNVVISGNATYGRLSTGGGLNLLSGTQTITGCVIHKNSSDGYNSLSSMASGGGGGAFVISPAAPRFVNCLIVNNSYDGIKAFSGTAILLNCTVSGNGVGFNTYAGDLYPTNCLFWGNGDDLLSLNVAGEWFPNYCYFKDGDSQGVNGCITGDAKIERGYRLGAGSVCIDAGIGTVVQALGGSNYTTQTDGTLDSGNVDIGYHYTNALAFTDYYVKPEGSDGNSGTNWAGAFATITKALSMAQEGTRISIASGTYTNGSETFPLSITDTAGMQLLGTNATTTVIRASGSNTRVLTMDGAGGDGKIEGLTFTGGSQTSARSALWGRRVRHSIALQPVILHHQQQQPGGLGLRQQLRRGCLFIVRRVVGDRLSDYDQPCPGRRHAWTWRRHLCQGWWDGSPAVRDHRKPRLERVGRRPVLFRFSHQFTSAHRELRDRAQCCGWRGLWRWHRGLFWTSSGAELYCRHQWLFRHLSPGGDACRY